MHRKLSAMPATLAAVRWIPAALTSSVGLLFSRELAEADSGVGLMLCTWTAFCG